MKMGGKPPNKVGGTEARCLRFDSLRVVFGGIGWTIQWFKTSTSKDTPIQPPPAIYHISQTKRVRNYEM